MDWLSKRKFVIVCYEKVVRIPLEGDEIFRVHGERTLGAAKALMNAKVDEPRISDIPVARDITDVFLEDLSMTTTTTMGDALSGKQIVKSRRVRGMILAAQSKAFKQENVLAERLRGLDPRWKEKETRVCTLWIKFSLRYLSENEIESPWILSLNFQGQSNNSKEWNSGDDQLRLRWMIYLVVLADAAGGVRDAIGFEYCLASSSGWTKSPILWAEIGESSLTGLELVQETTDKAVLVKEKPKAVTPWKGVVRFRKKGKLAPRYVGPFEILERIDPVAYSLRLPEVFDEFPRRRGNVHGVGCLFLLRVVMLLCTLVWASEVDHMKAKYSRLFIDDTVESSSYISGRDFPKEEIL
ncbi:hypothetical protein Tco_0790858 [Tanacetum coccineum]